MSNLELTLVVPAYNEERRIGSSLATAAEYLERSGLAHETVVVDDGSTDQTAAVVSRYPGVKLIRLPQNRGKGAAVKAGLIASRGALVLVSDADFSTPISEVTKLEAALSAADVAIGSRGVAASNIRERQPLYRELMGKTFNLFIRSFGVHGFHDTQCGFKLLRGDVARELGRELRIDGFAYDVELIWLAQRHGYRIAEVGVEWANSPDSRVSPVTSSLAMMRDVLRIRFTRRGGAR